MSGTYFGEEDSNEEVIYGPTDTEDNNTTITNTKKSCCSKRSTTESDSESTPTLPPKKKVLFQNILDYQSQQKTKQQLQILLPIQQLNTGNEIFNLELRINQLIHL
jgi:hypothetical protein